MLWKTTMNTSAPWHLQLLAVGPRTHLRERDCSSFFLNDIHIDSYFYATLIVFYLYLVLLGKGLHHRFFPALLYTISSYFPSLSNQYTSKSSLVNKAVYLKLKWTKPTFRWWFEMAKTTAAGFSLGAESLRRDVSEAFPKSWFFLGEAFSVSGPCWVRQ